VIRFVTCTIHQILSWMVGSMGYLRGRVEKYLQRFSRKTGTEVTWGGLEVDGRINMDHDETECEDITR
jgi:hypothetical protein